MAADRATVHAAAAGWAGNSRRLFSVPAAEQCIYVYQLKVATSTILGVDPVRVSDLENFNGAVSGRGGAALAALAAALGAAAVLLAP